MEERTKQYKVKIKVVYVCEVPIMADSEDEARARAEDDIDIIPEIDDEVHEVYREVEKIEVVG